MKTLQLSSNAKEIVGWLEENSFQLHNTIGIPTHFPRGGDNNRATVLDLCFSRGDISGLIDCWTIDNESTSDHSIVGLRLTALPTNNSFQSHPRLVRAWSQADWPKFQEIARSKRFDFSNLGSKDESTRAVAALYEMFEEGISEAVPLVPMKPKFAPWWSKNLEWLTTRLKRARKRYQKDSSSKQKATFESLKGTWETAVKKAKTRHWKSKLEKATMNTIWTVEKRHTQCHTRATPDIDGESSFEEKCSKFRTTLFPTNSLELPPLPRDFVTSHADLSASFSAVSRGEVTRALKSVNRDSSAGSDRLTYTTLIYFDQACPSTLPQLATSLLKMGFHPKAWKHATCVVIPKPGKKSYSSAKSYRPISLLSCLGKFFERIAATRIAKAGKICGAISEHQFGNKDKHSAVDCLFRMLCLVSPHLGPQSSRGYKYTTRPSLAAHDILGAFNFTRPDMLVKIMKMRKMPDYLIEWVRDFSTDRTLSFSFDNSIEEAKEFCLAIPQGSPASPNLFSIMMSAILDGTVLQPTTSSIVYVDDMSDIYADVNIGQVVPVLERSFEQKRLRANALGLEFETEKTEVMHLSAATRRKSKFREHLLLTHTNPPTDIPPSNQIKLLGVIVDETLTFIVHSQHASSMAMQALGSLMYLRAGKNGISPLVARQMVISKVIPRMFWASPIWWIGTQSVLSPIEAGYHRTARWITGLPPSTRISKLLRCAHLPPLKLWLDLMTRYYAIRIITLPADHSLQPLPNFDASKSLCASPHRILSFVSDYLSDRLECRSRPNFVNIKPNIIHLKRPQSEKEKENTIETHKRWIHTLRPGAVVIYSDGSRSISGKIGAGWVAYQATGHELEKLFEGSCYLGQRMEVFDAELHAVAEALQGLTIRLEHPRPIYICIDNTSAILSLQHNPDNIEAASVASAAASKLVLNGSLVTTIWLPSHSGIPGNEAADTLAKSATTKDVPPCTQAYTSVAWMKRQAKDKFLKQWAESMGVPSISWEYPRERGSWTFKYARAIFRTYCSRTEIDTYPGQQPKLCRCQHGDLSSQHIIADCPIFEGARGRLTHGHATPPPLTAALVLDKEWGPKMHKFLESTGVGFRKELKWNQKKQENDEEDDTDSEEFQVGMFE